MYFPFLCSPALCNPSSLSGPRQLFLEPFTRQLEERPFYFPFCLTPPPPRSHLSLHPGASPWPDLPFLASPLLRCSLARPSLPTGRLGSLTKMPLY